jgi:hypothetical protein
MCCHGRKDQKEGKSIQSNFKAKDDLEYHKAQEFRFSALFRLLGNPTKRAELSITFI